MIKLVALVTFFIASFSLAANNLDHKHHTHKAKAAIENLKLNHGHKWAVDSHTKKMAVEMKNSFFSASHADLSSLKKLGETLLTQKDKLIAGCTMTGKAHDQLHVFLQSHIPAIIALKDADNYQAARSQAIKLKGQFALFEQFFE